MVLFFVCVVSAEAYIRVKVDSTTGSYIQFGSAPTEAWDTGVPMGSMFYVAWAGPDNVIDPTAPGTYLPSGDDKICTLDAGQTLPAVFWTGGAGGPYGQITGFNPIDVYAPVGEANFTGKTGVYLRVFDATNPVADDHYVSGSLNGTNITWGAPWDNPTSGDEKLTEPVGGPETYEELNMTASSDATDAYGGTHIILDSTIQVIPEPGTLGLLALGLAGVFAARKKRK